MLLSAIKASLLCEFKMFILIKRDNSKQQGFTLIELMVVVVILAILLSVAIVSLQPNHQAQLRQQTVAFKGSLIAMCDKSAFEQRIYALIPTKKGIEIQKFTKGQWQETSLNPNARSGNNNLQWHEAMQVSWQLNEELAKSHGLEQPAWLCWPSGEINAGTITFELNQFTKVLQWNEILNFTTNDNDQ